MVSLPTLLAVHPPEPVPTSFHNHPHVGTFDRDRLVDPATKSVLEILDDLRVMLGSHPQPLKGPMKILMTPDGYRRACRALRISPSAAC